MNKITENKLFERLNDIFNTGDRTFINVNLEKKIADKLKSYQVLHVQNLISILINKKYAIDCSDTGTGKTYSAIATAKHMNLRPLIICPLSIINSWKKVCEIFEVTPLGIINYEVIRSKGYDKYVEKIVSGDSHYFKWNIENTKTQKNIVIFDESHKCKNHKTLSGKLLLSTKKYDFKVLLLSATISDSPTIFAYFGYIIDIYKTYNNAKKGMNFLIRQKTKSIDSGNTKNSLNRILFPEYGSRMELKEISDSQDFTENQISVDCYTINKNERESMNEIMMKLTKTKVGALEEINQLRQHLEKCKISVIIDLTKQYLENNISVAIFMNYTRNIKELSKKLGINNIICGNQTMDARNKLIDDFQSNKINIIICNIKCSVGISLHDLYGKQRASLICPNFSSIDLIQTLGRIYRANLKTPALQRIILCSGTYEETIYNKIMNKIQFINKLNDSDIMFDIKSEIHKK